MATPRNWASKRVLSPSNYQESTGLVPPSKRPRIHKKWTDDANKAARDNPNRAFNKRRLSSDAQAEGPGPARKRSKIQKKQKNDNRNAKAESTQNASNISVSTPPRSTSRDIGTPRSILRKRQEQKRNVVDASKRVTFEPSPTPHPQRTTRRPEVRRRRPSHLVAEAAESDCEERETNVTLENFKENVPDTLFSNQRQPIDSNISASPSILMQEDREDVFFEESGTGLGPSALMFKRENNFFLETFLENLPDTLFSNQRQPIDSSISASPSISMQEDCEDVCFEESGTKSH